MTFPRYMPTPFLLETPWGLTMKRSYLLPNTLLAFVLLAAASLQAHAQTPDWTPAGGFTNTMAVLATVSFDGQPPDSGDLLAAFVGNESRGVVSATNPGGGAYVFILSVGSNTNGETLTFKAYDASANAEHTLCESLVFRKDAFRGAPPGSPIAFMAATPAMPCALNWQAPTGFPESMIVNAKLLFAGATSTDAQDRVAAFVGGELRGVGARSGSVPEVFVMEVWGLAAGEVVTFRTYDQSSGQTYAPSRTESFSPGAVRGTAGAPVELSAANPIPVELIAFKAVRDGEAVLLRWQTASETNNAGFFVEREAGSGARAWEQVAFVEGWGTTTVPQAYQHRIEALAPGRHAFRLKQIDFDGAFEYSPVVEIEIEAPRTLALLPNYPNPFNPRTTLAFTLPNEGRAVLTVSDVLGRQVAVLFDGVAEAGRQHTVAFEAGSLATGLYVYTLAHGGRRVSRTLLLTK